MSGILDTLQNLLLNYGLNVLGSVAIVVIGVWVVKQIVKAARNLLQKVKIDQTLVTFLAIFCTMHYWLWL